jgi:hypothetical protein
MVFSVSLDYFIASDRDKPVVGISRHQDRLRFPEKQAARIRRTSSSRSTFQQCNGC